MEVLKEHVPGGNWQQSHLERAQRLGRKYGNQDDPQKGRPILACFARPGEAVKLLTYRPGRESMKSQGITYAQDLTPTQAQTIKFYKERGVQASYYKGRLTFGRGRRGGGRGGGPPRGPPRDMGGGFPPPRLDSNTVPPPLHQQSHMQPHMQQQPTQMPPPADLLTSNHTLYSADQTQGVQNRYNSQQSSGSIQMDFPQPQQSRSQRNVPPSHQFPNQHLAPHLPGDTGETRETSVADSTRPTISQYTEYTDYTQEAQSIYNPDDQSEQPVLQPQPAYMDHRAQRQPLRRRGRYSRRAAGRLYNMG